MTEAVVRMCASHPPTMHGRSKVFAYIAHMHAVQPSSRCACWQHDERVESRRSWESAHFHASLFGSSYDGVVIVATAATAAWASARPCSTEAGFKNSYLAFPSLTFQSQLTT